jgi:hypothetical protein
MQLKLTSTLTGAALALALLAQSDFAAALGCKYQEALGLNFVGAGKLRICQDNSANGQANLQAAPPGSKQYVISTELLNVNAFSSRMRLLTAGGQTNNCDKVDQLVDGKIEFRNCSFTNQSPAVTFLFNAGDSVGP